MTSTTDVPRKGDRVRVSWKDGEIDRTAEFTVDDYSPGIESAFPYLARHPEIAYKSALGRGFFVIGPGYSFEILERAEPEPVRFAKGDRVRFTRTYAGQPVGTTGTVVEHHISTDPSDPSGLVKVELDNGEWIPMAFGYRLEAIPQPEHLDVVPGMVLRGGNYDFIATPGGYYDVLNGILHELEEHEMEEPWSADIYTVVFDPRDAEALPSPFGIKPGDQVKRVSEADGVTETVEFEVNHVDVTGMIAARYGTYYSPVGFEVQNREVPTRLPAGTILRGVRGMHGLRLITEQGGYYLGVEGSPVADKSDYAELVKQGYFEVIYLP